MKITSILTKNTRQFVTIIFWDLEKLQKQCLLNALAPTNQSAQKNLLPKLNSVNDVHMQKQVVLSTLIILP